MLDLLDINIKKAIEVLKAAKHVTAFTGAGISVESGIPSYRGQGGIWMKYNPRILELNYFLENPKDSWTHIRKVFYEYFKTAKPNTAHEILAEWEKSERIKAVITQNIDNLHQEGGSQKVIEFHGNSQILSCMNCGEQYRAKDIDLEEIPPLCNKCGGLLKPDFIFFGEPIPRDAFVQSAYEAENADVFLIIGTTGEVFPASQIPKDAADKGATIIEINPEESAYTKRITDIHLKGKASEVLKKLRQAI